MTGFLLNMINRHQGMVDRVQPRIRSMFEPESATAVATDNASASNTDATVKESLDTGFEKQIAPTKSTDAEKLTPDNPLAASLSQPVLSDESPRTYDLHSLDRNRMDLMNEQVQGLLARLVKKTESQDSFNGESGLQQTALSPGATEQATVKVIVNEQGLTDSIEETLRRFKSQTSNSGEGKPGVQGYVPLSSPQGIKTGAEQRATLSAQPGMKVEELSEPLSKSGNHQEQTVNTPIRDQGGSLQMPAWLTDIQTNLNNRWQEINAKSQTEPIINVTIGRVEVRAINTEPAKPGAASKKPTGVLSLDDYLKQREHKGRT